MNFKLLKNIGLHPFTAFIMIVVDMMLFGPDATGIGWLASCLVAAAMVVPCLLIQRFSYKDEWMAAIGKGLLVGIVTAIPTPLPAVLTGLSGIAGFLGMEKNGGGVENRRRGKGKSETRSSKSET